MYDGFICDDCGFTSEEEVGQVYYCPKCGKKMRRAKSGGMYGGGDANPTSGRFAFDILYVVFVGGLSFCIMNYVTYWTSDVLDWVLMVVWFVLFVASWILIRNQIKDGVRGKAKKF